MKCKIVLLGAAIAAGLTACKPKAGPPVAELPVHNAFVDHIERGRTAMDNAQTRVDAENARLRAQDQAAQQTE